MTIVINAHFNSMFAKYLKVWNVQSRKLIEDLPGHADEVILLMAKLYDMDFNNIISQGAKFFGYLYIVTLNITRDRTMSYPSTCVMFLDCLKSRPR